MAIYYTDALLGDDANPGTIELPKRSLPHAQTGKNWTPAVVSGDIVRCRVGRTYTLGPNATDRFVPIAGVTYEGYGYDLATILEVPEVIAFGGGKMFINKVGTGLWKIDGFSAGATFQAALVGTSGRTNVTLADMWLDGAGAGAATQIEIGNAGTASGGIVLRRCLLTNAPKVALQDAVWTAAGVSGQALTLEDVVIARAGEDLIKFNSSSTSFCVGQHTFRRCALMNPNWNAALGMERPLSEVYGSIPGGNGDCIQVQASAGRFEGAVLFDGLYCVKEGGGKQFVVMHDALNGWIVRNFMVVGAGTKMVALGQLRGRVRFERGYFADTTAKREGSLFRFNPIDPTDPQTGQITNTALNAIYGNTGTPGVDAVYNGWLNTASVTLSHIVAAPRTGAVFLMLWEPQSTGPVFRIGCPVTVENCTSMPGDVSDWTTGTLGGALTGGFDIQTVGAQIATWSTRTVFDGAPTANAFMLTVRNNALLKTGIPAVRQPTGTLNDARFNYRGNAFGRAPSLSLNNTTSYAGLAAMQAAHTGASGNLEGQTVSVEGPPYPGSPLLTSGVRLSLRRDYRGAQGRSYIGAFGQASFRAELIS